ncbi:hypothetical protein [uncultured Erythrobacter sp.]|uniref:hypothetical protein n=1 Tax=uncultured Erythrobacter sp. TaxID=263913 RepID=UPI00260EEF1B|nr:hypothetical protein [uncultured Erythrobacter sp.]
MNRPSLFLSTALCASLVCAAPALAQTRTQTQTFTIQKSAIQNVLNQQLSRTRIHIDNLGARNGGSFLQQDSYVALRVGNNAEVVSRFNVPEQSITINQAGGRHLRFYISDFNTSSIRASLAAQRNSNLNLQFNFESSGSEVQGKCVTRRGVIRRRWEECRLDVNRNANINNAILRVWAPVIVRNGRLTYGEVKANFRSSVSLDNRLCNIARRSCNSISDKVEEDIAYSVVPQIKSSLEAARPQLQRALLAVNRNFSRAGFRITNLVDQGASYRVTIRY